MRKEILQRDQDGDGVQREVPQTALHAALGDPDGGGHGGGQHKLGRVEL